MRLFEVVSSPWAVMPSTLDEIRTIYEAHLRGEGIDIAAVEARLSRPLNNEQRPYQVVNGVAIVPMVGVLAKRANMFSSISGGTSTQMIGDMFDAAVADKSVKAIVLEVDSPGGAVEGVQQLANKVRAARGAKPIEAVADGVVASGAYWIASAADKVFITDLTTVAGSIGVVSTHSEDSERQKAQGVKRTDIYAGKYKRLASSNKPLSQDGQDMIQSQVDHLYSVFVEDVAANRGVPVDKVLSDMADGRVFVGQQAIDAGLVDGVETLDAVVARLSSTSTRADPARPPQQSQQKGAHRMDMTTLKADHTDLYNAVMDAGRAEGSIQGATAERERILGIEAHAFPGHEGMIAEMKADGKTTPDMAASRILRAEKESLTKANANLRNDAPPAVPSGSSASGGKEPNREELVGKAQALSREKGITLVAAFKELGIK